VQQKDVLKTYKIQEEGHFVKNMKDNMGIHAVSMTVLETELKIHWHAALTRQNGRNTNLTTVVQACLE